MKKKFLKFIDTISKNFWVQLGVLMLLAIAVLAIGGTFDSPENVGEKTLEIITGTDLLSVFLAAFISLIVAKFLTRGRFALEESLKLEDDHHKIISKYYGHAKPSAHDKNAFVKDGEFMRLERVPYCRRRPRNMVQDKFSKEYERRTEDIEDYTDRAFLRLSGVNVYANVEGNTKIVFDDSTDMFELPPFISEHAKELLDAHGGSSIRNSATIRLVDAEYASNVLTLKTQRSQYFHMLVTNRCMDYKLNDRITVREIYEQGNTVSPLSESKLGNQIGINGLIFTKDGKVVIEKRGKRKTTWKDKFAQPISLALKECDFVPEGGTIGSDPQAAEKALKKIVLKTVADNFGLAENDLKPFSLERNFLGLARDLIEGGKPNMYFYVVADMTAAELKEILETKALAATEHKKQKFASEKAKPKKVCGNSHGAEPIPNKSNTTEKNILPSLADGKLDGEIYIADMKDLVVDFGYKMKLDARNMLYVKRRYYPRVKRIRESLDDMSHKIRLSLGRPLEKECGEALLACLYYADLCRDRLSEEMK